MPLKDIFGGGILAGAADSFLGGVSNALFGGIQAKRQWKYQQKQMAQQQQYNLDSMWYQHQYNMDAWNRENEYNKPTNVRARYEEAGISPQAALGGSVGAGIAGSMSTPSSNPPSGGADYSGRNSFNPSALSAMATLQSINESKARQKKTETESAGQAITNGILDTNAEIVKLDRDNKKLQNAIAEINKRIAAATESGNIQQVYAELLTTRASYDKLLADTSISIETRNLIQAQIRSLDADIELRKAQTQTEGSKQENLGADTKLKNEQAETEGVKREKMRADIEQIFSNIGLTEVQTAKVAEEFLQLWSHTDNANSIYDLVYKALYAALGRNEYEELANKTDFMQKRDKVIEKIRKYQK